MEVMGLRDKINDPEANYVVGKYSTGLILSEWMFYEEAATHAVQVVANWTSGPCPYAVYTREEWEGGYKA